jgi:hypothetical protein
LNALSATSSGLAQVIGQVYAINGLIALELTPQLRFSYSYDFTVSKLQTYNSGSHEFALRYQISKKQKLHQFTEIFLISKKINFHKTENMITHHLKKKILLAILSISGIATFFISCKKFNQADKKYNHFEIFRCHSAL